MSDLLDDLTAVLAAQSAELRALVPLLEEQQAALARADSACVAETMSRQEPALGRLLRLEQRRQAVVKALGGRLGLDGPRLTISTLLAMVPGAPSALGALRDEMRRLLEAVDRLNRHNAFLIERAVACLDGLVRAVIAASAEPEPVYVATGRPAGRRLSPRLLDRRA